jgi:hypothetical protein
MPDPVRRAANQPMPGSHPRARRVRPGESGQSTSATARTSVSEAPSATTGSGKRRMSIRLVGEVRGIAPDQLTQGCMGCVQVGSVLAETASGWLPLCAACLKKARRAQVEFERSAPSRAETEAEQRRREGFARHGLLSGGGANGTGGRRR